MVMEGRNFFLTTHKNIGNVLVGKMETVYFHYEPDPNITIVSLNAECGCSTAVDELKASRVKVTYVPKPVPRQLKEWTKKSTSRGISSPSQFCTMSPASEGMVCTFRNSPFCPLGEISEMNVPCPLLNGQ